MADIRINSLPTTASASSSDDFIAIDGTTNGTRKLSAYSPTFGGNLTVSGTTGVTATDLILGTSGPSAKSSINARAARQGLVFDGTNGASFSAISAFGTGDFTVSAWVKFSALSGNQPIFGGASNSFWLYLNTSVLAVGKVNVSDGTGYSSALVAGKTYHVSYVRSGGTGTYYVNGVADGTSVETGINYSVGLTEVGSSHGNYFKTTGNVSGAFVYNRALSASEVVSLYEAGAPSGADYNSASNTAVYSTDFSSSTGWSLAGSTTISGGKLNLVDDQYAEAPSSTALVAGKNYRFTITVDSITAGAVYYFNGSSYVSFATTAGTYTVSFTAVSSIANFYIKSLSGNAVCDTFALYNTGLLLAPDAAQAGGGLTWYDTSGNAANITLPASGVSWNVPSSRYLGGNWTATGTVSLKTPSTTTQLDFQNPSGTTIQSLKYTDSDGSLTIGGSAGVAVPLIFTSQSGTERMRMFANGNFGIGTGSTDGGQKLQVSGSAKFAHATAEDQFLFFNTATIPTYSVLLRLSQFNTSADPASTYLIYADVGSGASAGLKFAVSESGKVKMPALPTSSAGLSAGDLWNDSGTVKIA